MRKIVFLFIIIGLITHLQSISQGTFHEVGNGNVQNQSNTYPSIYGNYYRGVKNQFLIKASEMQAAGMSAGNITGLAFDVVTTSGATLEDLQIELKSTAQTSITTWDDNNLTSVYGPVNYVDQTGWNQHNFSNPFYWDGTSNILIKTCFYNSSWADNAIMNMSNYSYNTLIYRRRNNNPCTSNWINGVDSKRPNVRFQWLDPNTPPIANLSASSTSTCSGLINFTDISSNSPTSWVWDFGDGNTSTMQNPNHTYTSSGSFDVQLIASNPFGSDTIFMSNFIQVNLAGASPIPNSCTPSTQNPGLFGCGITSFQLGSFNKSSGNSIEGYSDFTCDPINVFAGQSYTLSANYNSPVPQNFSVWIDLNNNGVFDPVNEEIFSEIQSNSSSANIQIPSNATINTPLRLRIMSDFYFSGTLDPCTNPTHGQAEDYTIIISIDTSPPNTEFSANQIYSCDGQVEFSDLSTNVPFAWYWEFGDGNSSIVQNPNHNYSNSGIYDVTLITTNSYGSDTLIKTQFIEVDTIYAVTPTAILSCYPSTLNYCCDYGITRVQFANINHPSADALDGYSDFSCDQRAMVNAGTNYSLKVFTGPNNPQDTRAWIDFNNDGVFDNTENVMEKLNTYDPVSSVQIPSNVITNKALRMRISSDEVGNNNGPCDNLSRGQVEDYSIFISQCDDPQNITIGQITASSVELSWNRTGYETSWSIIYGPFGFNIQSGSGTTINNITSNNHNITGLNSSFDYDFYLKANCIDDVSNWVGPYNAITVDNNENIIKNEVNIYPNPNNGVFTIKSIKEINSIEIVDIIGKSIFSINNQNLNFINVDLSKETKGIYFVKVSFNEGELLKKVICK